MNFSKFFFLVLASFNLPILKNVGIMYEHIFSAKKNSDAVLVAGRLSLVL